MTIESQINTDNETGCTPSELDQETHPILRRAGIPARSSQPFIGRIPGAHLSPEASAELRDELRAINLAETAVRGSDVIVYPNS